MSDYRRNNRSGGGRRFSGGGGNFRDRDRDRRPVKMHKAVCDKCGSDCEVPFKPSTDKPIYCNNCFDKGDRGDRGPRKSDNTNKQLLEQMTLVNEKLDKLIEVLAKPTKKKPQNPKQAKRSPPKKINHSLISFAQEGT